jgi:hypothetical protein
MKTVVTVGVGGIVKCVGFSTHEYQYAREFEYEDQKSQDKFVQEIQALHPFAELHLRRFI